MRISAIVPTLNEAAYICATLDALAPLRARGHDVIVVDGGSTDATVALATGKADRVITAARGRARQMNVGARIASADVLLFVHADTRLPEDADRAIVRGLAQDGRGWGRFDVRIESRHPLLGIVGKAMNFRSRLSGVATGDQAMFMRRTEFEAVGGFPPVALMEDIAMSRLLRHRSRPACLGERVVTSARRWESKGVLRTIALMWWLRWLFFLGASPDRLARNYDGRG